MAMWVKFAGFLGVFWLLGCADDIPLRVLPTGLIGLGNPRVSYTRGY